MKIELKITIEVKEKDLDWYKMIIESYLQDNLNKSTFRDNDVKSIEYKLNDEIIEVDCEERF